MTERQSVTARLLAEITRMGSTRQSIAVVYREAIKASGGGEGFIDWPTVNRAILKRYSVSGLTHIKKLAWK